MSFWFVCLLGLVCPYYVSLDDPKFLGYRFASDFQVAGIIDKRHLAWLCSS